MDIRQTGCAPFIGIVILIFVALFVPVAVTVFKTGTFGP